MANYNRSAIVATLVHPQKQVLQKEKAVYCPLLLPDRWIFIYHFRGRNRVVSASMPGVTAEESTDRQVQAFDSAVSLDGFNRILGAAWRVTTAVADIGAQQVSIGANWEY